MLEMVPFQGASEDDYLVLGVQPWLWALIPPGGRGAGGGWSPVWGLTGSQAAGWGASTTRGGRGSQSAHILPHAHPLCLVRGP